MRQPMLERGVYTIPEACRYINAPDMPHLPDRKPMSPITLHAWFLPRSDRMGLGPLFESEWNKTGGDFAISFLNLIEAFVARFFKDSGVKPKRIRRTHEVLQRVLQTPHPFASLELRTNGQEIISCSSDKQLVDYVAKQLYFPEMRNYLAGIEYDPSTLLAQTWSLAKGVAISPKLGFGRPIIRGTGVSTLIVANQYLANGKDAALVARLFKIPEEGVLDAFGFENRLGHLN